MHIDPSFSLLNSLKPCLSKYLGILVVNVIKLPLLWCKSWISSSISAFPTPFPLCSCLTLRFSRCPPLKFFLTNFQKIFQVSNPILESLTVIWSIRDGMTDCEFTEFFRFFRSSFFTKFVMVSASMLKILMAIKIIC